jgi:hypothetical protein
LRAIIQYKGEVSSDRGSRRRVVRRRKRVSRRAKVFLLALGLAGLLLGVVICGIAWWREITRLKWLGAGYLVASLAILAVRGIVIGVDELYRNRGKAP